MGADASDERTADGVGPGEEHGDLLEDRLAEVDVGGGELHDTATVDDALFDRARALLSDVELLDAFMLCGWYHAISFTANAAGVAAEDGAPTFDSVAP